MNNTHLSLFSGIGGLDLAAEWAGFRTVAFVERDKYCQRVLAKHWPGVPIFDDVCKVTADAEEFGCGSRRAESAGFRRESSAPDGRGVGLISGGFPCQPHSVAGKRKASLDERDLWSECARITGEFKPRWAVFENVPGLLSSEGGTFFARVLGDLAALGYSVGWGVWGANDVGALHRRDRVFIVANSIGSGSLGQRVGNSGGMDAAGIPEGGAGDQPAIQLTPCGADVSHAIGLRELQPQGREQDERGRPSDSREDVADASIGGCAGSRERGERGCATEGGEGQANHAFAERFGGIRCVEPGVGRGFDGVPGWLDGTFERGIPRVLQGVPQRVQRLRALGNAVVPQQAYVLFKAIAEIEGIAP